MSVDTWVVTPSMRLDGTKAIATQPTRVRIDGPRAGSATEDGSSVGGSARVRLEARPAITPQAPTIRAKPT